MVTTALSLQEVQEYLDAVFPEKNALGDLYDLVSIEPKSAEMVLKYHPANLRPGGTISGPAMMALADITMYAAILGNVGRQALAVTTHFSIDFLNKPIAGDILAHCKILKLGKRLVVLRVEITSIDKEKCYAHAVGTYSIPPQ